MHCYKLITKGKLTDMQFLRDDKKLNGWIYQITRNAILDYFRKTKLREVNKSCLYDDVELKEEHITFARCLRPFILKLSENDQQVLELTDIEKLSQKELAECIGISYSGWKSRVQRAREKNLKICLNSAVLSNMTSMEM